MRRSKRTQTNQRNDKGHCLESGVFCRLCVHAKQCQHGGMAAWQHPPWQDDSMRSTENVRSTLARGVQRLRGVHFVCIGAQYVSDSHCKAAPPHTFFLVLPLSPASTGSGPLANPAATQAILHVSSFVDRLVIRCAPPGQPGLGPASTDESSPTRGPDKYSLASILRERYEVYQAHAKGPSHRNRWLVPAVVGLLLRPFSVQNVVVLVLPPALSLGKYHTWPSWSHPIYQRPGADPSA